MLLNNGVAAEAPQLPAVIVPVEVTSTPAQARLDAQVLQAVRLELG